MIHTMSDHASGLALKGFGHYEHRTPDPSYDASRETAWTLVDVGDASSFMDSVSTCVRELSQSGPLHQFPPSRPPNSP